MLVEFTTKFYVKGPQIGISQQHSSESIHTWIMGTLEGLLRFHKFGPQGHALGIGWRFDGGM